MGTVWPPRAAGGGITQQDLDDAIATRLAANAAAGGVLSGNYPAPGFAVDMATQAELDAAVLAAGGGASGPAGGVLSGAYPNPGFAVDMATQAELDAAAAQAVGGVLSGNLPNPGFAVDMATQAELNAAIAGVATLPIALSGLSKDGASIGAGAFRVHNSSASLTVATGTQVPWDTEDIDLQGWFAANKYTPQVKGLYLVASCVAAGGAIGSGSTWQVQIRKNNAALSAGAQPGASGTALAAVTIELVAMNGTTDFLDVIRTTNAASPAISGTTSFFAGVLLTPQT